MLSSLLAAATLALLPIAKIAGTGGGKRPCRARSPLWSASGEPAAMPKRRNAAGETIKGCLDSDIAKAV